MSDTAQDTVLHVEDRGAVRVFRLNRPEARNALNGALVEALGRALIGAEQEASLRAIVLTGVGDRAFCAGMDLRAFAAGTDDAAPDKKARDAFFRMMAGKADRPVIAAANGTAVAGGFELLLGCDLVVASSAARFGLPEAKRGLFASGGGMFLATRIPLAAAMELVLTGDPIDAARALELGLVNKVVGPEAVLETALDLAARVAANGPLAIAASRELLRLATIDAGAAAERQQDWRARIFSSEDAEEGARAFVEKRDPVWRGR